MVHKRSSLINLILDSLCNKQDAAQLDPEHLPLVISFSCQPLSHPSARSFLFFLCPPTLPPRFPASPSLFLNILQSHTTLFHCFFFVAVLQLLQANHQSLLLFRANYPYGPSSLRIFISPPLSLYEQRERKSAPQEHVFLMPSTCEDVQENSKPPYFYVVTTFKSLT